MLVLGDAHADDPDNREAPSGYHRSTTAEADATEGVAGRSQWNFSSTRRPSGSRT